MRHIFLAVFVLLCFSYVLTAQNRLPKHINFDTAFTIYTPLLGKFFFSDTSYRTGKIHLMWNNANGVPHTIDEYYRMNARLGDAETDLSKSPQSLCVRDTNFHLTTRSIFKFSTEGGHSGARSHNNPLFGIALHYDVCAPKRTRYIPGTTASYEETYPDWSDETGGAFGFLARNGGYDSVFSDGNKQRVYRESYVTPGTVILTHPYPNDELIRDEVSTSPSLPDTARNNVYGYGMYLSLNVRLLDTNTSSPDDTVLIVRLPYTTKPGKGAVSSPTRLMVFDSIPSPSGAIVPIYATFKPTYRGSRSQMIASTGNTLFITRRMLRDTASITLNAHFRLRGDENGNLALEGMENHALWHIERNDIYDTIISGVECKRHRVSTGANARILRLEPEIIYKGHCDLSCDWVRLETKAAKDLFTGLHDDDVRKSIQNTIDYFSWYWNSYPGKMRWHRLWITEEDLPRTFHANGYANRLVKGRGTTETGYTTAHVFREFNEMGVGIESTDPPATWYRAGQIQYYTEHSARETGIKENWRGDTYSVVSSVPAPFLWNSTPASSAHNLGLYNGYFQKGASSNKELYDYGTASSVIPSSNDYRLSWRWPNSSLLMIENAAHRYASDPYFLFDTKHRWYSSVWVSPPVVIRDFTGFGACTSGVNCARNAQFEFSRPITGEELRFTEWFARILASRGDVIWVNRSKSIVSDWDDVLINNPPAPNGNNGDLFKAFIGYHTKPTYNNPAPAPTTLTWLRNESLGSDYLLNNDPTFIDKFSPSFSAVADTVGIQAGKFYLGRKTMRYETKLHHDWIRKVEDTLIRFELDYWHGKGFRTFDISRNISKEKFFHRKIDTSAIQTKRIAYDSTLGLLTYSDAETTDSSYYDITLLRDGTQNDTNVFYVGVLNRQLDPVFTIPASVTLPFGVHTVNTAISSSLRFCSLPTPEFDSLLSLTSHPLVANKTIHKYCQNGARQISLPFKVRGIDDGDYPLLRIRELGGAVDTVIGCDKPLALNYQPGEGKIFRVKVLYPDRFTGDLSHSNQTKLVSHNIMRFDSVRNKWVEGDSVVYHAVYFKEIVGKPRRTGVYYRVSTPIAMASNTNALTWHNEILLSDSIYHHGRFNKNDTCAYPSVIVRFDSVTTEYRAYIVYTCTSPYWGIPAPLYRGQHIVENIVRLNKDSILVALPAMPLDTLHTTDMRNYGTPMINASDTINFYAYASKYRGIVAGWKKPDLTRFLVNKTTIHYTDMLNCYAVSYDTRHPSMNPYSRYQRGQKENDCALVWQEKGECIPHYNIFTTRLRVINGNITYGLSPKYAIPLGYTVLFNFDSTIFCLSAENLTFDISYSHEFPVHYRELWDADDSSAVCDFQLYYPGHTPTDMRLDRTIWEVHNMVTGGGWFLGERGNWYRDTLIGGTFVPNDYGVGWRGNLWLSPAFPLSIDDFVLDQPSISAGMAAYYQSNPMTNWSGCVNSYTQRAMNFNFRSTLLAPGLPSTLYSLPQTHMYPPVQEIVDIIDYDFVEQSHVASRGSVLLNDWWRNHRIYNKTAEGTGLLATPYVPYQIRSSGQHYYRFGDNALQSLNVVSFGNENGSYGIGTPTLNNREYPLHPQHSEPQRINSNPFTRIDTLQTEWFRIDENDILRYCFSGSNPEQTTVYLERKSDGAQWLLPNMRLREYELSTLAIDVYNGNSEEYRITAFGNEGAYFIQNTALANEQTLYGKTSKESYSLDLRELPISEQQLSLYPNPSSDKLTIGWSGGKARCQIINSEGHIISEQWIMNTFTLDTQKIPNGLYIVRLQQGNQTISKSVIILK